MESYQPVGLTNDCPTRDVTIDTALNGTSVLSTGWQPTWPAGYSPGDFVPAGVTSSVFGGLSAALSSSAVTATLTVLEARYQLSIAQQPSAANDWTLILGFNYAAPKSL